MKCLHAFAVYVDGLCPVYEQDKGKVDYSEDLVFNFCPKCGENIKKEN